ncbi:glycosyltransferase domain-containing protein [uncultured Fibrobacter sp.]|uniref:glycosyltransferase domain-containing protein n=1 Tax=uncultured Fibrobacter sp. TaxID=261512 RepID=UPI0025FCAF6B|nr:glycosyltransferase domain-containing protein [uncultured Fibrobacter sp.]
MNKYVIYTAVIGNYDKILQPKVVDPLFDYILFSDDISKKSIGIWQVRKIGYHNKDQIKIARWVKTHPEKLLSEYEFSVWMDANVQIQTDFIYKRTKELFDNRIPISSIIHPDRNCIYQEIFAVFILRYETTDTIVRWSKILQKENFPHNKGLNETNIVFRNHNCTEIEKIDSLWWNFIEQYSRRDQFSFNYVLWKLQISCTPLLPPNESARNSKHFNLIIHTNPQAKVCSNKENFSWLQHYCVLYPNEQDKIKNIFFKITQKEHSALWLRIYGLKYRIIIYLKRLQNLINRVISLFTNSPSTKTQL